MKLLSARFKFVPQDLWIGVFWKREEGDSTDRLKIYVGLFPMVILRIVFEVKR